MSLSDLRLLLNISEYPYFINEYTDLVQNSLSNFLRCRILFHCERTCSGLLYKLPNFFKFLVFNRNSYDHVAEILLVHNC